MRGITKSKARWFAVWSGALALAFQVMIAAYGCALTLAPNDGMIVCAGEGAVLAAQNHDFSPAPERDHGSRGALHCLSCDAALDPLLLAAVLGLLLYVIPVDAPFFPAEARPGRGRRLSPLSARGPPLPV